MPKKTSAQLPLPTLLKKSPLSRDKRSILETVQCPRTTMTTLSTMVGSSSPSSSGSPYSASLPTCATLCRWLRKLEMPQEGEPNRADERHVTCASSFSCERKENERKTGYRSINFDETTLFVKTYLLRHKFAFCENCLSCLYFKRALHLFLSSYNINPSP